MKSLPTSTNLVLLQCGIIFVVVSSTQQIVDRCSAARQSVTALLWQQQHHSLRLLVLAA